MLIAAQKSRCAKLAAALDAGDYEVYRRAEPTLGAEERGLIWDLRAAQVARAAQGQQVIGAAPRTPRPPRIETSADLDFWSDDEPVDDGDDNDDPTPLCGACNGTGKGRDGGVCVICNGKGTIPAEDQKDDDNDDFEDD